MKRAKRYPPEKVKKDKGTVVKKVFDFNGLLEDPLQQVLAYAQHSITNINTVCKKWKTLIDGYQGWYEMMRYNLAHYRKRWRCVAGPLKVERIVEIISNSEVCKSLSASEDVKYARFLNYVGYMLNSKLRKLVLSDTSMPVTDSILTYMDECSQNVLSMRNFHKQDFYLNFTEIGHLYTLIVPDENGVFRPYHTVKLDDNEALIPSPDDIYEHYRFGSPTGFIGSLFPHFDEDDVIDKMMLAKKWSDPVANPYYGMKKEEIKAQWERIRKKAAEDGTIMHQNIEFFYSMRPYTTEGVEFAHFKEYEKQYVTGKWRPYRTEPRIWSIPLELCGSVDILYEYVNEPVHNDGKKHLVMCDWKRSKRIEMTNIYQSGSQPCTQHAPSCNWIKYNVQMCLYKYILETHYDIVIDEMYLVVLHPNQKKFICMPIDTKNAKPLMDGIIQHRLDTIANRAKTDVIKH